LTDNGTVLILVITILLLVYGLNPPIYFVFYIVF